MDVTDLLPPDGGLAVRDVTLGPDAIRIEAETIGHSAQCPRCGMSSDPVHGRSVRTVADLPWQGRQVRIRARRRRFRCRNTACPQQTFTERLPAIAAHARTTRRLAETQRSIGFALGGEPGSRLARKLAMPTSPDTLLRRVRAVGQGIRPTSRVLGVDDFAFRKASTYGTILVDLERRITIDLLRDREAASLAHWLREHPGVEVISRDRASAYAQAAREAAPGAIQVADRWHLLANLRDTLERFLQHRSVTVRELLRDAVPEIVPVPVTTAPAESRPAPRAGSSEQRLARFERVRRLHAEGMSLRGIARALGLHYRTVERYVRSDHCPDWQPGRYRPSLLNHHESYIRQRFREGCCNAAQIRRELQQRGCSCGKTIVKDFVRRLTAEGTRPAPPTHEAVRQERPALISLRRLAVAVVRRGDERSSEEQGWLERLRGGAEGIGAALELAEGFASLIRGRRPAGLDGWLRRAEQGAVPELRRFASRLRQDEAAVRAGIEMEWSNGPTEGHVNRLKLVKRSMYGRASFELLCARVLHAG